MATNETFTDNVWENPALQPFLISHVKVSDEKLGVPGAYGVAKKVCMHDDNSAYFRVYRNLAHFTREQYTNYN